MKNLQCLKALHIFQEWTETDLIAIFKYLKISQKMGQIHSELFHKAGEDFVDLLERHEELGFSHRSLPGILIELCLCKVQTYKVLCVVRYYFFTEASIWLL